MIKRALALSAVLAVATASAVAQVPVQPALASAVGTGEQILPRTGFTIPPLTPVTLEVRSEVGSRISKIGDSFKIRLAAPIDLGGGVTVPAGIAGEGQVVQAAKSGFGGKPGELILAVRWLDWGGTRIRLRSLRYAPERGKSNEGLVEAMMLTGVGVIGIFINGGEIVIPAGTIVYAKTAEAVAVPPALLAALTTRNTAEGVNRWD